MSKRRRKGGTSFWQMHQRVHTRQETGSMRNDGRMTSPRLGRVHRWIFVVFLPKFPIFRPDLSRVDVGELSMKISKAWRMAQQPCTYCQNSILTCRIKCVECEDFDLCLQVSHVTCFSSLTVFTGCMWSRFHCADLFINYSIRLMPVCHSSVCSVLPLE